MTPHGCSRMDCDVSWPGHPNGIIHRGVFLRAMGEHASKTEIQTYCPPQLAVAKVLGRAALTAQPFLGQLGGYVKGLWMAMWLSSSRSRHCQESCRTSQRLLPSRMECQHLRVIITEGCKCEIWMELHQPLLTTVCELVTRLPPTLRRTTCSK